jgi:hypothetical protein
MPKILYDGFGHKVKAYTLSEVEEMQAMNKVIIADLQETVKKLQSDLKKAKAKKIKKKIYE